MLCKCESMILSKCKILAPYMYVVMNSCLLCPCVYISYPTCIHKNMPTMSSKTVPATPWGPAHRPTSWLGDWSVMQSCSHVACASLAGSSVNTEPSTVFKCPLLKSMLFSTESQNELNRLSIKEILSAPLLLMAGPSKPIADTCTCTCTPVPAPCPQPMTPPTPITLDELARPRLGLSLSPCKNLVGMFGYVKI